MSRDPVYESATGRSASPEAVALRRWIHERYLADQWERLPGRFRYYEAISAQVIAKQMVQEVASITDSDDGGTTITKGDRLWKAALMWVREHGLVPDHWITDTTRSMVDYYDEGDYATVDDFDEHVLEAIKTSAQSTIDYTELDLWDDTPPLLVVESAASAEVLTETVRQYRMRIAPLQGQGGRSFLANDVTRCLKPETVVLGIGDLDKAGGDIQTSAQKRLEGFCGHALDWRHIALTDEQVDLYAITRVPRVDRREKPQVERMVAETEALGAARLRSVLAEALDDLLAEPLVAVQGQERNLREAFRAEHGYDEDD